MTEDWSDLKSAWSAPDAQPPIDAALLRDLRRRAWLARVNFGFEAAGCLLAIGLGGWVWARDGQLSLGLAAIAFGVFSLAMTLWARAATDPGAAETPRAALESALEQARAGRRWSYAGIWISLGAAAFLGLVHLREGLPRGVLALVAVLLMGFSLFYARHARDASRRVRAHQAALEALDQS